MSLTLSVDLSALDEMISGLEGDFKAAARPAAQAAAQVLYEAVKANVAAIGRKTGNLDSSIYQAYSEKSSAPGKATYNVSWNPRKAPHGGLVEFGHIQRYAQYLGKDGNWYTAVRPSMRGKRKPSRNASQAVKDAYYVPRAGGAAQIPARSFVRKATAQFDAAAAAATAKFLEVLGTK
jgi:hypothetical protein